MSDPGEQSAFVALEARRELIFASRPSNFSSLALRTSFLKIFVVLDKVAHHVGIFYFFGQNRVNHVHMAKDFKQVSYGHCFPYGVENLDDPVEQIQGQGLVMLGQ